MESNKDIHALWDHQWRKQRFSAHWTSDSHCHNMLERKIPCVFHKSDGKQTFKTHTVMRAKCLPWAMNHNNYSHMKKYHSSCSTDKSVYCTGYSQSVKPDETLSTFQKLMVLSSEPLLQQTAWHGTYGKKTKKQPVADRRRWHSHCNIVAYLFSFSSLQKQQTVTTFLKSVCCIWDLRLVSL